jgi:transposase
LEEGMTIIGCDVSKDFVILYDGERFYFYGSLRSLRGKLPKGTKFLEEDELKELLKGSTVILEQTGSYGIRYAKIFESYGARVLIADGKEFKRFRHGRHRNKNDLVDAKYLREFFFSDYHCRFVRTFHEERFTLRALVRHVIRTNKDLTRSVNRLKQYLAFLFPNKDYYDLPRNRLFKELPKLKEELSLLPSSLTVTALSEIEKIETCLKTIEKTTAEIKAIVENHKDYEILKTFPHFGLLAIATLIAYYYDINDFPSKDAFIGYVLMGSRHEQSGVSLNVTKTDKTRTEVKGIFYMIYLQACRKSTPLKPLTDFIRANYYGGHNNKKRFIKFLDKLLEMVYYALRHRLPFQEVLKFLIEERNLQLEGLKEKRTQKELTQNELFRLYRTQNLLLVYQDISDRLKAAECLTYYNGEESKKEVKDELRTAGKSPKECIYRPSFGQVKEQREKRNEKTGENLFKRNAEPNKGAPH